MRRQSRQTSEGTRIKMSPDSSCNGSHMLHITPPTNRQYFPSQYKRNIRNIAWSLFQKTMFRLSPIWMHQWRSRLLAFFGASIGKHLRIHPTVTIIHPENLRIGNNVSIEHQVILECTGPLEIRDNCRISQYAYLNCSFYDHSKLEMSLKPGRILIGKNVWLASDVFIESNVTIGDNTIIGARSCVKNDIPNDVIAYGYPAKPAKTFT